MEAETVDQLDSDDSDDSLKLKQSQKVQTKEEVSKPVAKSESKRRDSDSDNSDDLTGWNK